MGKTKRRPLAGAEAGRRSTRSTARLKKAERSCDLNKLAELKYGRLPALQKELQEEEDRRGGPEQCQPAPRQGHRGGEIARSWAGGPGFPFLSLMEGERDKLLRLGGYSPQAGHRPGRGGASVTEAILRSRRASGPGPPYRVLPVFRPHRRGQNRACQGAGSNPV